MPSKLSPTQNEFIRELFGASCGNVKDAAKKLGIDDVSMLMTDELVEAIKNRADQQLALSVPKAIYIMNKMLEEPESSFGMDKIHKLCGDILDRVGVSKRERNSSASVTVGLVFLPNKQMLPEPPNHEIIDQQSNTKAIPA